MQQKWLLPFTTAASWLSTTLVAAAVPARAQTLVCSQSAVVRSLTSWLILISLTGLGAVAQAALNAVDQFNFTKLDANGNALAVTATNHACVKDNVTGLVWEVKANDGGLRDRNRTYTFDSAAQLANDVNAAGGLCGFTDWRVPNPQELVGIVNYSTYSPKIDTNFFSDLTDISPYYAGYYHYWTSSAYDTAFDSFYQPNHNLYGNSSIAWFVDFGNGYVSPCDRDINNTVRLVRGEVTDDSHGLMWAELSDGPMTLNQAMIAAQNFDSNGYSDWRVPNVKELQSIFDYNDATSFPINQDFAIMWLWSPIPNYGYFDSGFDSGYINSTESHDVNNIRKVWLVRGGQPVVTSALNVTKAGNGTGTVTSIPIGINCGAACSANFIQGVTVTLTATPAGGSAFKNWSGNADCSDGQVTMDAAKNCIATFRLLPLPTVVTKVPSVVTAESATLQGAVNPNGGAVTDIGFYYGVSPNCNTNRVAATPSSIAANAGVTNVSSTVSDLSGGTKYCYEVVATSAGGIIVKSVPKNFVTFTCLCPDVSYSSPVTNITNNSATLNGIVTPKNCKAVVQFTYDGVAAPNPIVVPANAGATIVSTNVTGLSCNKTIPYRITASNSNCSNEGGAGSSFTTAACPPPTVEIFPVTNVTQTSATLYGRVTPNGANTNVAFYYGIGNYNTGISVATFSSISANAPATIVTANLPGLLCGKTYNYKIVASNSAGTTAPVSTFSTAACLGVIYQAHVQNIGWLPWVSNGGVAGTTGQSRRMEAVKIQLFNATLGVGVLYRAHVQNIGWLPWVSNGAVAGTTGQSRRMEAIQIQLTGNTVCSVQYRAHVQNIGWLSWVSNGAVAGTTGQSRRMEALQVVVSCP